MHELTLVTPQTFGSKWKCIVCRLDEPPNAEFKVTSASILKFEWLTNPLSAYRNYRRRTEELARILRHE
jgi:hypothetical protein